MNVEIQGNKPELALEVGDIIQYETTSHRFHPFYIVCHIEDSGYFVMSLTGEKTKARFYKTLRQLLIRQKDIKRIYSHKQWKLTLEEVTG